MGTRAYRTVLIGNGNVASMLARSIGEPFLLTSVGGRQRRCPIPTDADLYIIAVSDRAVGDVAAELADVSGLVVHTAGSVPMDVLPQKRRGVLYPLQTISRTRELSASHIPLYVETAQSDDMAMLQLLAQSMGTVAQPMDSERRRYLHLAAVFCNNFVNRLYGMAGDILSEHGIPFTAMLPLIRETAEKVQHLTPRQAQTGPAVRWDEAVMREQLALLRDGTQRQVYQLLSQSIHDDKLRPE